MIALLIAAAALTAAPAAPVTLATARASMLGRWQGKLEYRDYRENKWFGIPVAVTLRDMGDGATTLRTSEYDDGPKTGIVRITSLSLLAADGTEYDTSFRKGRVPDLTTASLALTAATDPTHWTIVATTKGQDDNRPATLRETSVRNGASLITLKEVDFQDDQGEAWLARNRTTLMRVAE